jgi:hypothetical protein
MSGTSTRFDRNPPAHRISDERSPHHVAEAEDEGDGVERERDLRALGERLHRRHELQVHELVPQVEGGGEEVVDARDAGRLQQQPRLRAALLARHQHLGDRRRLRVREAAVRLAHEVAPQRDQEQGAEAGAGRADEDRLRRVRIELQRVERRQREDRPGRDAARHAADAGDDHVLEQARAPRVDAREADREDRDRDRRLHHLPDLEAPSTRTRR